MSLISWGREFNSLLCVSEEPSCVALGKLLSSRVPPEEETGKPFLSTLKVANGEIMGTVSRTYAETYFPHCEDAEACVQISDFLT